MGKWLRRVRGAIGMGVTWGAAWSVAGFVLAALMRFQADAPFPIIFGVLGFLAGIMFSVLFALTEGRRQWNQMSLRRFAGWGAAGGIVLSAVFARAASLGWGDIIMIVPTFAVASALCATGSLALARRALGHDRLHVRGETGDVALTDHEESSLLGGGD